LIRHAIVIIRSKSGIRLGYLLREFKEIAHNGDLTVDELINRGTRRKVE